MADQSYSSSTGSVMFSAAAPVEATLTGAGVKAVRVSGSRRYSVTRIAASISGQDIVSPSNSVVLTVYRWTVADLSAGAITLGTITIPAGTTKGSVYVREFSEDIQPGESVVVSVTTPAAGTAAAGNAVLSIEGYESDVTLPDCPAGATTSAGADKADAGVGQLFRVKA